MDTRCKKLPAENSIKSWTLSLKLFAKLRENRSWEKHRREMELELSPLQTTDVQSMKVAGQDMGKFAWGDSSPLLSFQVIDNCQRTQKDLTKERPTGRK